MINKKFSYFMTAIAIVLFVSAPASLVRAQSGGTQQSPGPLADNAPSFLAQPVDQTVDAGQSAIFHVAATGTAPLSYQWEKNGVLIEGATDTSYTTPPTGSSDNASGYTVVVANPIGSVTSSVAFLTVAPPATQQATKPVVNVVAQGADTTGNADSYGAFMKALAASNNVYVPCGTYKLSATIKLAVSGQRLYGAGDCSVLVVPNDTTSTILLGGNGANIQVSKLSIMGQATQNSDALGNYAPLIGTDYANPPSHFNINNIHFTGPNPDTGWVRALDITGGTYGTVSYNVLDHGFGNQWAMGILLGDGAAHNLVTHNTLSFPGQVKYGIAVRATTLGGCCNIIDSNKVNGGTGASVSGGAGIIVYASVPAPATANIDSAQIANNEVWGVTGGSEEALEAGIQIGGQTTNTLVANNFIHNNAQHGIVVEDDATTGACKKVIVVGNEIYSNARNGIYQRGCTDNEIMDNYIHDNDAEKNLWTAATNAAHVIVTTSTYHKLDRGPNVVFVYGGVGDWAALNGVQTATYVNNNQFSINVDTSGWKPFATSGAGGGPQQMYASMADGIQLNTNGTTGPTRTMLTGNYISGTTQRYAINIVQSTPPAVDTILATNHLGSGSVAALFDAGTSTNYLPSITSQPMDQQIIPGQSATFTVAAAGSAPLSYRWMENGRPITGATGASYTTLPTKPSDDGSLFTVVVSNSLGQVTSRAAILTMSGAPTISREPESQTVNLGQDATFTVAAAGSAPLSYQWMENGRPITGATGASYTTPASASVDNGSNFTVVVNNSLGSTTSTPAVLTLNGAPAITSQPSSQTVNIGKTAVFSVTAAGSAPLSYQWMENGVPIPGATNASYYLATPRSAANGSQFTAVVSNSIGSVTSTVGVLTVKRPPAITTQPAAQTVSIGQAATFTVKATGDAPLSYQWIKNGNVIPQSNSPSYTTPAAGAGDNGSSFVVMVLNSAGLVSSNAVTLTVDGAPPVITAQPLIQRVNAGQAATFTVAVAGNAPLSYQWMKGAVPIPGANGPSYATPATVASDNGSSFMVVASNSFGSVASNSAILSLNNAPVIHTQPLSQRVNVGQTASFSLIVSGSRPLSYQWMKGGIPIPGATGVSYTTPAATLTDNGSQFTVKVSNSFGAVTSTPATITVNRAAPIITIQPSSQTANVGQSATFSVQAASSATLSYQWEKNGTPISGATGASYTTPVVISGDNGSNFQVIVSSSVGSVTSTVAVLTVANRPFITTQPMSQAVNVGQAATFSAVASGSGLSYQWMKNGQSIAGANSASYTTPAAASADNGSSFTVVVSNSLGSVTSNAATLSLNSAPTITAQPMNQIVNVGQPAVFSLSAAGTDLSYQWEKNYIAILGATSASYTTPGVALTDNGARFTVIVSNSFGSATSHSAMLTLNGAPVITTQPVAQTVKVGQTATFSVAAAGIAPLHYQWEKNYVAIAGANSSSYTTPAVTSADNGDKFRVVVSNSIGSATSTSYSTILVAN